MLDITVKRFNEIDTDELYQLLQLRSRVFVVEQACIYQDLDGKDQKAIHIIGKKDNRIVAYTRAFTAGDYFEQASIGRVVVSDQERSHGYGKVIMEASIKAVEEVFKENTIKLSAQTYLKKFYNSLGFKAYGEGYLEDGIPHIVMLRN
ncbi:GNAT family N-acetyltransferase [Maribacter sp. MJ134]|jgi:ElaA protein|uniref:GNAT family N-acetyltransferase n=1 Tax=Maribacter sp. MJ134 TaxID=2496865 RepID=UPI000F816454|nr:GNAT family N-acetyltransferase [Maribacter sp. MJ134]AZQ59725.1 GNAT family N-acetyltransferase [Maribacter sp. MJ134]